MVTFTENVVFVWVLLFSFLATAEKYKIWGPELALQIQALIQFNLLDTICEIWRRSLINPLKNNVPITCKSTDWFLYDGNIGR